MSLRKFSFTTVLLGLAAFAQSGERPIRRGGVKLPFIRAIGCWTITVLGFSLVFLCAQEQKTEPLTVPAYHNLPTAEGYFQGAGGVRLFYRVAGRDGDDPIVFLHGSSGGINIGG